MKRASPVTPSLRRRRIAAFSIFEVMIASIIMALVITTSITVMQRGYAMLDTARKLTIAGQYMASQMEQVRMCDWTTLNGTGYLGGPYTVTDSTFTLLTSHGSQFTLTRTITAVSPDMLQITLNISWTTYDGRTISRSYTSYFAHYGIHDYLYTNS